MLLALIAITAWGGPFEPVRSRDPLPAREVERGLVAPMGWTGTELSWSRARTSATWGVAGRVHDDPDRTWQFDVGRLTVRHGWTRGMEGWVTLAERREAIGWHGSRGADAVMGVGDPSFGVRGRLLTRESPGRWLAWEASWGAPLGAEGAVPEDPAPGGGTADVGVAALGRLRWGGMRIDGRVGAVHRFTGRVPRVEDGIVRYAAFEAGDALDGRVAFLLQAGPLWVEGSARGAAWTAGSWDEPAGPWAADPAPVAPSRGGFEAWAGGRAAAQLTRGVALAGGLEAPIRVEGAWLELEQVHASPTASATLELWW